MSFSLDRLNLKNKDYFGDGLIKQYLINYFFGNHESFLNRKRLLNKW